MMVMVMWLLAENDEKKAKAAEAAQQNAPPFF